MSLVKNVEWNVNILTAEELESYLNKKSADGFELFDAFDKGEETLVLMHKTIPPEGDWKTTVGLTSSATVNKLRQKSRGHANE
jgi:hypothetical protein